MDTICGNSKRLNLERSPLTAAFRTYFEGDPAGGLEPDTEAKELWLAAGMAEDHIVPGNLKVPLRRCTCHIPSLNAASVWYCPFPNATQLASKWKCHEKQEMLYHQQPLSEYHANSIYYKDN